MLVLHITSPSLQTLTRLPIMFRLLVHNYLMVLWMHLSFDYLTFYVSKFVFLFFFWPVYMSDLLRDDVIIVSA